MTRCLSDVTYVDKSCVMSCRVITHDSMTHDKMSFRCDVVDKSCVMSCLVMTHDSSRVDSFMSLRCDVSDVTDVDKSCVVS